MQMQSQMQPNPLNSGGTLGATAATDPGGNFGATAMTRPGIPANNMTQLQMVPAGINAGNFPGNATNTTQMVPYQAGALSRATTGNLQAGALSRAATAGNLQGQLRPLTEEERLREEKAYHRNLRKQVLKEARTQAMNNARNAQPMHERMMKTWKNEEVLKDIDNKLNYYITRHGGRARLTGDRRAKAQSGPKSKELQILERMKKEEEAGALALPVEEAAQTALRSGLREYIDYAVDEVERYAHISKTGAVTADFDWSACGDHHDVPALRRSQGVNRVDAGLEKPLTCVNQGGLGSDDMFEMDFLRDFCAKGRPPISEEQCELQMKLAVQKVQPPALIRADNKAPLFEKARRSTPDLIGSPVVSKFGDREWMAKYSIL